MKLEQSITQTQTGFLVPVAALCCLVLTVVGMGIKLPWFRRQMRLGNMAQRTATASTQRGLTASVTNMPSQGVFRRLSFEDIPSGLPPPPPPRPVSTPVPLPIKEQISRPVSQPPPSTKPKAKPVILPPPPKSKAKTAPPTRQNPNAISFNATSAAAKPVKPPQTRETSSPVEASNPMLQAMRNNASQDSTADDYQSTPNGYGMLTTSVSPKPASKKSSKKDVKARNKKEKKSAPVFAKMTPKEVATPAPVPSSSDLPAIARARYSSGSDEEGDGNFTFRLPDTPQPVGATMSFLHMNVGESDECDA